VSAAGRGVKPGHRQGQPAAGVAKCAAGPARVKTRIRSSLSLALTIESSTKACFLMGGPNSQSAFPGRIIGRVDSPSADVLVPTVLHTTDPTGLPVSMRPQTLNVSRIPNDAFVVYLLVVRLLDGRTVRCFHRYSEIREFVTSMKATLGKYRRVPSYVRRCLIHILSLARLSRIGFGRGRAVPVAASSSFDGRHRTAQGATGGLLVYALHAQRRSPDTSADDSVPHAYGCS